MDHMKNLSSKQPPALLWKDITGQWILRISRKIPLDLYKKQSIVIAGCIGLVVVAGIVTLYFWNQNRALKQTPQRLAQEKVREVVELVGQLIVLPEGETPTVATVTDPERLRDQPFFAKSRAGDKVLIYTNARKAILYRPFEHKLVEVAPLNIGQ